MVSQRPKHEETHTASNNPYTYHFFKAELMHKRNTPHNILRPGANQEHHVSVSVSCLIFTRHTLERPRYIPPAAQFEGQRGTDLRQPPASSMSQYQKTQTVSQFYDKILAKTGTLEVEIKVDTKVAKQLMPKLKVKKNKVDTSWFKSWKIKNSWFKKKCSKVERFCWGNSCGHRWFRWKKPIRRYQKWAPTGISREHNQRCGDFNDLSIKQCDFKTGVTFTSPTLVAFRPHSLLTNAETWREPITLRNL